MNKEILHNIRLGIFVVAGVLLLITGLYFIGSNKNMFGSSLRLYATFQDINGLQSGNNVRYAGIDIGTVEDIKIINDSIIRVEMSIREDLNSVIRNNSIASIGTDGLMGNKLVNIEPGTKESPYVKKDDELMSIQTVNTEEMLRTLELTNMNVAVISGNLKELTDNINKSRGTLYKVLMDSSLAGNFKQTIDNIETVSSNLSQITGDLSSVITDVKQGKGLLGALLKDTVMAADLQQATRDVKKSTEQINASAGELKQSLHNINNGDGTISLLLNDTATANHLKQSIINIETSAKSFNDNMEALKHSFLFRGYFKKQEKKNKANSKNN